MDIELQVKQILVELEYEHKHLQATIGQLKNAIDKREIEIRKLLAERELSRLRSESDFGQQQYPVRRSQTVDFNQVGTDCVTHLDNKFNYCQFPSKPEFNQAAGDNIEPKYSSEFSKKVSDLLDKLIGTSEEVSSLIRL